MPQIQPDRRTFTKIIAVAASAVVLGGRETLFARAATAKNRVVHLENLNIQLITQGWGKPHRDQSVGGNGINIGGRKFKRGIGTHVESVFYIRLHGAAEHFSSWVGMDEEAANNGACTAQFSVISAAGKVLAESPVMRAGEKPYHLQVSLRGVKDIILVVQSVAGGINWGHVDWADPIITLRPGATEMPVAAVYRASMEVPTIASGDPETPEIHGPRVAGCTPGKPFLFQIPATGQGELTFTAENLPAGLHMDQHGLITGKVAHAGEHMVKIAVKNHLGHFTRTLKIIAGEHKLARTPQMGWNSWNAYGMNNSAARTKAAADAMVRTGLAAKGFQYINIDDGWQNGRDANGQIKTTAKFGNMKDIIDHVHSRGLRFGLYSSPGPTTCGGHTGSYHHVRQDAQTYAAWGVDFLKYDWCSYGNVATGKGREKYVKPYAEMGQALIKTDRDIFFSLCQYGMDHVWKWGGEAPVFGNSWRICGDINDSWGAVVNNGFNADAYVSPHRHIPISHYAKPGNWNDPDILVVGVGSFETGGPHPTNLTPNEQLSHITLWCMAAAPLLIGCNLDKLDKFTTDLLTNTEVLAVDQDELGRQAMPVLKKVWTQVWARPLYDGTYAVALFNLGFTPTPVTVKWSDLAPVMEHGHALTGRQPIRDLWKRKDLGAATEYTAVVPVHGAVMLKVGKPAGDEQ